MHEGGVDGESVMRASYERNEGRSKFAPPRMLKPLPVTLSDTDAETERTLFIAIRKAVRQGLPESAARYARCAALLRWRCAVTAKGGAV